MSKHTPGPWQTEYRNGIHSIETQRFADDVAAIHDAECTEEGKADARLIAAAPALLAACKVALARHEQALAIRVKLTGISTGAIADEITQLKTAIALAEKGAS